MGITTTVDAQAINYFAVNAQTTAGTYTDLGSAGTAITTPDFDDSNSDPQPLGFTFLFGGSSFTQFVLNTNGYLKLGSTAPVAPYFSNGSQDVGGGPLNSADTNLLLPFNTDLEAGLGGTEYRVATTGAVGSRIATIQWKNVSDKARLATPGSGTMTPKQYASLNFQVRLYEGTNTIEFVYGSATASTSISALNAISVGLKGNGTASNQLTTIYKYVGMAWNTAAFQDGNYSSKNDSGYGFGIRSTILPDAGRTYHFNAAIANDLTLAALYNIEQLPAGQGYSYRSLVINKGSTTETNLVATLTISGANSATLTQTIASLVPSATSLLTWPLLALPNAGINTIVATIPPDATPTDNSQTAATLTTVGSVAAPAIFSYLKSGAAIDGSYGFGTSTAAYVSACCAAYTTASPLTFSVVRAQLGTNAANVGQKVYGLLADLNGNVLAQSAEYTIQASDLGTLHTFVLTTPVLVPAGTVLAGMAQEVNTVLFFANALQTETPGRLGTFYTLNSISAAGVGTLRDINAGTTNSIRFLVETGSYDTTLATASPLLAQALAVYPNPSATGRFSLAVRGANAPAGLAVLVLNQLGQVVYTGTARDNAITSLDLGYLRTGLYYLQLRNGGAFTSRALSIGH
ncbi:T9SS type A sorting domain-containing protein [Hymenobacter sp. BRD128]|uniref:T9SS type A sorting domain-containing protein n=1 Tax=Hymenobacter sp. BRD128 TaxID=2675878 RepID=UPI001565A557|nr:T9SS type A sorting domain-containing protein [Hymenobacter sp. BRD128]QKG57568.1 T9SS type A sorting domain-containing protein [Hymenobacter sp. BRD128]